MTRKEKILILTGALGDGHNKAAQAILEAAQMYRPDVEIVVIDFLEWSHPYLHSVGKYCYIKCLENLPFVYGFFYRKTHEDNTISNWFKRMKSFSTERMLKLLDVVKPTEVVSTFPGAAAAMSYLKSNYFIQLATITVMTDYTDHSYWIHPYTDKYIVGAEYVKEKLLRHRIPEHQIVVTGIPLRLPFTQMYDRLLLRNKYHLDPMLPTVLIMGGGQGLIGKQFISVLRGDYFSTPVQFIFVCGRNEKMKKRLEAKLRGGKISHCVVITGFVEHVHELMALSDIIVTKPGGLTVSEALALEIPMILYKPIPGQEQDNAKYLIDFGAAMEAKNINDLIHQLQQVIQNHTLLLDLKRNVRVIQTKEGALHTLAAILEIEKPYVVPIRGSQLECVNA